MIDEFSKNTVWYWVQAVPLPEVGEAPVDPGQLPKPDKLTKAYFEVCTLPCPALRCPALPCPDLPSPFLALPWQDLPGCHLPCHALPCPGLLVKSN